MQANHLDAVPALQSSVGVPSYGTRLFGYIIPPTSATYTFAVSGDDAAELRLSPSTDLAQAVTIAYTVQPTPRNVYSHSQSQRSKPIPLEADTPYAFEVLHKQAEGEDHVQVAWSTNGRPLAVIQHSALALFDTTHTHEDNALDDIDDELDSGEEGDEFDLGAIKCSVLHTPGHTVSPCRCFLWFSYY